MRWRQRWRRRWHRTDAPASPRAGAGPFASARPSPCSGRTSHQLPGPAGQPVLPLAVERRRRQRLELCQRHHLHHRRDERRPLGAVRQALNTTYSFELPSNAGSTAELQQQLNAQGARGFSYAGPDTLGAIYRKDNGSSSTYSYRVLPEPADNTVDGLLAQDKAQGAEGYYHLGSSLIVGNDTVRIFQKDSQSTATYDVEVLPSATTDDAFMAQLEAQGARGFRFKSDYGFGDNVIRALYEKDTTQSATFSYAALTSAANANDLVTQANAQGANGVVLIGDLGLPSGTIKTLYVTPSACSGLLCGVRSAFGF